MAIHRLRVLLLVFAFAFGCAKSGSKSNDASVKPAETPAKPTSPDDKGEKKVDPPPAKNGDADLSKKCLTMSKTLSGKYKKWDLLIKQWTKGKDTKVYTTQEMVDGGYAVTYRLYPSDVEVTVDESKKELTSKLNTGNAVKTVIWSIGSNDQGKCLLTQNPHQAEPLLGDEIVIELAVETDGSKAVKAPLKFNAKSLEVTGIGEAFFER